MCADRQRQGNVSDGVTNVIQIGAEAAANIQLGSQNSNARGNTPRIDVTLARFR
jgi:hypothetical protein